MQGGALEGSILWVDLTAGSASFSDPPGGLYRRYLGGPGLGLYYLLTHQAAGCDPFSAEALLVFAPGLLTGSYAPSVPRYTVCARSPLTGALGKSEAGGYWGPELKRAGVGALVIAGRAARPSYLVITPDGVEIRSATRLWGLDTGEAEAVIREELGEKRARVAIIGPGGENLVRFAGIANDLTHFNGRNGLGAVMGAKNLKAIAVLGSGKMAVHDPEHIKELARWAGQAARQHPQSMGLHVHGTPAGVETNNAGGALPTMNWQSGSFAAANLIGGERLNREFLVERGGCFSCPVRCKRVVEVAEGELPVQRRYGGPEYETLVALGSNCGIGNMKLLLKASELCNQYTLDTISAGMAISFAMACFERGLLNRDDTGGLEVRFGNEEVLLSLIEQIAYRRGLGRLLADGTQAAAASIGRGAEALLLTVKGQEVPMHDPRVKTGLGLQYALSPNGADHWFAQHDPFFTTESGPGVVEMAPLGLWEPVPALDLGPGKVRMVLYTSFLNTLYDCLGVCVFGAVSRSMTPLDKFVEMVEATTGWKTSLWELVKAGERVNTMARLFNVREGFGADRDSLPALFFAPIANGPLAGKNAMDRQDFERAVKLYYDMAGWNSETGVPTAGKLAELGLDEFQSSNPNREV